MKKQLIILSIAGISLLFIASDVYHIDSAGAPIACTGAPGESTCAKAGCHTGSDVNSGAGVLDIDFNNGFTAYEPGKTYTLTVSLNQQNIKRFGFEMLALKESDSTNAGTLIILDTIRTQVLDGTNQYLERKYITYKYPGTIPYSANRGQWIFKWTAPLSDKGPIIFYAAAVSANDDGTDKGDLVYTKELTVRQVTNGISEETGINRVSVFPNPSNGRFEIKNEKSEIHSAEVYTIQGEKVYSNFNPRSSVIDLDLPDGVYFLLLHSDNHIFSKKLIIER